MHPKCHACEACLGEGCVGELPGMGGIESNANFKLNCAAWDAYPDLGLRPAALRLAPMTGAVQNIGFEEEGPFYYAVVDACLDAGVAISVGDGYPDEKLAFGLDALDRARTTGAVFCKPYEDVKLAERFERARPVAEYLGVDIDSYAIVTMRDLAKLERKTPAQMRALKDLAGVPFAIKGVFSEEDVALCEEVRPDVAVVSNHGGRVPARIGSSADALARFATRLAGCCGEVWVDGGIRKPRDLRVARALGASVVLVGRPFATALAYGGAAGVLRAADVLRGDVDSPFAYSRPVLASER